MSSTNNSTEYYPHPHPIPSPGLRNQLSQSTSAVSPPVTQNSPSNSVMLQHPQYVFAQGQPSPQLQIHCQTPQQQQPQQPQLQQTQQHSAQLPQLTRLTHQPIQGDDRNQQLPSIFGAGGVRPGLPHEYLQSATGSPQMTPPHFATTAGSSNPNRALVANPADYRADVVRWGSESVTPHIRHSSSPHPYNGQVPPQVAHQTVAHQQVAHQQVAHQQASPLANQQVGPPHQVSEQVVSQQSRNMPTSNVHQHVLPQQAHQSHLTSQLSSTQGQIPYNQVQSQSAGGHNSHLIPAASLGTTRARRRSAPKVVADVKYPINFPAHPVPPELLNAMNAQDSQALPPHPDDIRPRRYASGVDERNFFTVLEYELNSQPIIWDYYTGYVHLTGIWKAIGNSKADIVKLLDSSPELEPVIKRVRGGFLKIQGTWVPYDVARRLATHVCYYVRYALVPLFGPDFPEHCTKPNEPGFGVLQLNMPPPPPPQASQQDGGSSSPYHKTSPENCYSKQSAIRNAPTPVPVPPVAAPAPASESASTSASATTALDHKDIYHSGLLTHVGPHHSIGGPPMVSLPVENNRRPRTNSRSLHRANSTHKLGNAQRGAANNHSSTPTNNMKHYNSLPQIATLKHSNSMVTHHIKTSSFGSHQPYLLAPHHRHLSGGETGFKRRTGSRTSSITSGSPYRRDSVKRAPPAFNREAFYESAIDDEEAELVSPPPMPRKVSFADEEVISESPSEFLAMLKATRSLQTMSAGRPVKNLGGGFECGGRQFVWDGSDRLDMLPSSSAASLPTLSPPNSDTPLVKSKPMSIPPIVPAVPARAATPPKSFLAENNVILPERKPEIVTRKPEPTPPMESAPQSGGRLPSLANILNI